MKKRKTKAGRTRSPEGRETLNTSVPPYVKQWLIARGGPAPVIKRLVDAEMAREQRQADDYDAAQSENNKLRRTVMNKSSHQPWHPGFAQDHERYPDIYPSEIEYSDYDERYAAIASRDAPGDLGEAIRLVERPLALSAYRVAMGTRSRDDALAIGKRHCVAANGATMTPAQIERYVDLLAEAFRGVSGAVNSKDTEK